MIECKQLTIDFNDTKLVDIHFKIEHSLALVGQSGSGKSLTLKALLDMLPEGMSTSFDIESPFELIAGKSIGFVPQNPFTALSPLTKIKKQFFIEVDKVKELFTQVGLAHELLERFPPELSGGQLQRVVLAMALSSKPQLLLLDEPTTALDPQTRITIIELLRRLQESFGFLMLFVTHDMNSAEALCKELCVIKDGQVVESGNLKEILATPSSSYTRTLIESNFKQRNFRE